MRLACIAIAFVIGFGCPARADEKTVSELLAACDQAAASPSDKSRPAGIAGVEPEKIDPRTAIPACEAAARAAPNDARMALQLGRAYGAANDHDAARIQYVKSYGMGNPLAANNLAALYANGRGGLAKDEREAARLYKWSADQGIAIAQSNLGFFYQNGRGGLPKDDVEAARLHKLAAGEGIAPSQNSLGFFFENGLGGLAKNDREAARLYKLSADQEFAPAQNNLGRFYQDGRGGLPKDDREAARLYKLATDRGNAFGQANLGALYREGRGGLPKDDREAVRLYKLSADQGNAGAQNTLGFLLETGQGGLPKDDREAARLYKLSADQGNASGQNNLGRFYQAGRGGLPKDDVEAARLYRLAADQGNAFGQSNLSFFYHEGRGGLPKNDTESARLHKLAANQGNAASQNGLGFLYQNGLGGLPKDDREAARLYKLSADQGNASAQNNLGYFFQEGRGGLPKDDREAARLYKLAADQGNAFGQFNLGLFYENGRGGLAKDDREAARLVQLAADQGNLNARGALDRVNKRLLALRGPTAASPSTSSKSNNVNAESKMVVVPPGRRVALVIGNSAYLSVPVLPSAVRDAEAVAGALREVGFQSVSLVKDVTREKLVDALRSFASAADKSDWALIYYAGHGIEIGGMNYLIPVDAKLATDRDVQFEAVGLEQVLNSADGAKKLRLVLLDACRDNPFANQIRRTVASRSIGRGLAPVEPDSGMLVVYAAKHGQIALDGDDTNSPFVSALVKRMLTPRIEIRKLFDLVRDDVMAATARQQQPFSYGSVSGSEDYYFLTTSVSPQ